MYRPYSINKFNYDQIISSSYSLIYQVDVKMQHISINIGFKYLIIVSNSSIDNNKILSENTNFFN